MFPVDTISQTASDKPMFGAISTDPLILCISQFSLFLSKKSERVFGYEVAILRLFKSSILLKSIFSGIAIETLHLEKLSSMISKISNSLSLIKF